jgi:hypothetical protein
MEALEATLIGLAEARRSDERRDEMLPVERIISADDALTARRAAVTEQWRQDVANALAERGDREAPDLEDELAAAILGQIVERMSIEWRTSEKTPPVRELIGNYFETLRRLIENTRP